MESFKEFLNEGIFGFLKRKKKEEPKVEPKAEPQKAKLSNFTPASERHKNPRGPAKTMDTHLLHSEYDKLRLKDSHTDDEKSRYHELETERQNRGYKPRMTAMANNEMSKRVPPKPRIRFGDGKGGWKMGG